MKKLVKSVFCISVILVVLFGFIAPVNAVGWVYLNKYWSDDAIYDSDTETDWGATAYVRATDLDNLGVYCSTNGWWQYAWSKIYIDGGYDDTDPWTFPTTQVYYWKSYWYFSGAYNEESLNYYKFEYELYYMVGSTKHTVDSLTKEYTADDTWNSEQIVHDGGSVYIYSTKTYYLKCTITLSHSSFSISTSDLYVGGNEIDFYKVEFRYYSGGPF